MHIPTIRNAIQFEADGSYDRTVFSFAPTWSRTILSGAISIGMLFLCAFCIFKLRDPLVAGEWAALVPFFEYAVLSATLALMAYAVRDFLQSFRADVELNLKLAIANHWLNFGSYLMRNDKGQAEQFSFGDTLIICSRAIEAEDGLQVFCLIRDNEMPVLVSCRIGTDSTVVGKGEGNPAMIRRLLHTAAGQWHYDAAEALGICYEPAITSDAAPSPRKARQGAARNQLQTSDGVLGHLGRGSSTPH